MFPSYLHKEKWNFWERLLAVTLFWAKLFASFSYMLRDYLMGALPLKIHPSGRVVGLYIALRSLWRMIRHSAVTITTTDASFHIRMMHLYAFVFIEGISMLYGRALPNKKPKGGVS